MPTDFATKPPYNVYQPGAYSAVDATKLGTPNPFAGRPIPAILGTALGGQPLKPLYFTSPGALRNALRSGPGYDAARFAFDGGAPQVCFVRVGNSPTPASLALLNSVPSTVLTLTSIDWGTWNNSITVTVASGPIITIVYTDQYGSVFTEKWDFTNASPTPTLIASAINGGVYGYNASNYVTAAAGAGALPLVNVSAVPLTGGTDGLVPVAGDWTNGLTALETEAIDIIVPATGDGTVHAQVQTHCQNMSSSVSRRERVGFYGGLSGETVTTQVTTRIAALRSARSKLCYPGMYDFNALGQQTLYDPFYMAAKLAGMACALPDVATSLVHKYVPIIKAEVDLSTAQGGAIDQLLQAGVTPIAPAGGGGYWVIDDLTGYNASDQTFRDMNKTRAADFVAQYCRSSLGRQFVGSKGLATTQGAIQSSAGIIMDALVTMQIISAHLDAIVDPGPILGSWTVGLPVMLINTNKFLFLTVQLQPSSTVQPSSTSTTDLG